MPIDPGLFTRLELQGHEYFLLTIAGPGLFLRSVDTGPADNSY